MDVVKLATQLDDWWHRLFHAYAVDEPIPPEVQKVMHEIDIAGNALPVVWNQGTCHLKRTE